MSCRQAAAWVRPSCGFPLAGWPGVRERLGSQGDVRELGRSGQSLPDRLSVAAAARWSRTATLVILASLITLFAVLNIEEVKVPWIFGSRHAPLIIVIVVSLLVGIVLAHFAERKRR